MRHAPIALAALAVFTGCMDREEKGPGLLSNSELDWRDEVIYQVMTDRFADGDVNNNFGVDRSAPRPSPERP